MAHIEKNPNGSFRVRWQDASGQVRSKNFDRKGEASSFKIELEAGLRGGLKKNVEWLVEEFIADKRLSVKAETLDRITLRDYEGNLRRYVLKDQIAKTMLSDLDTVAVDNFLKRLISIAPPKAAARVKNRFGMACGFGKRKGYLLTNPAQGARLETTKRKAVQKGSFDELNVTGIQIPTPDAAKAILAAADAAGLKQAVQFRLLFNGGLRPSEALGLARKSIHFQKDGRARIKIVQRLSGEFGEIGRTKTEAATREITLGLEASKRLREYMLQVPKDNEALLFPSRAGTPLFYRNWWESVWCAVTKAAGYPRKYTPHDGRHYAVSAMIASGAEAKEIQAFVGHENIEMTLNTYGHLFPKRDTKESLADAIEASYA